MDNKQALLALIFLLMPAIFGCGQKEQPEDNIMEVNTMKVESPDFKDGTSIPADFTCDGFNMNPNLILKEVPKEAKSIAIIMDDPDAPSGTFVHWLAWNISPAMIRISAGERLKAIQGKNDFGKLKYGGPCPPSGTHRYFFKLYALDTFIGLKEGSTKQELENAMKDHILAEAKIMGTYKR